MTLSQFHDILGIQPVVLLIVGRIIVIRIMNFSGPESGNQTVLWDQNCFWFRVERRGSRYPVRVTEQGAVTLSSI